MAGTRRAVAVGCIALIVFAAFLPLGGLSMDWLIVTPAFTLLPSFTTPVACREASRGDGRSVALLAILDDRGPPAPASLA
jgi:hypothetical protein